MIFETERLYLREMKQNDFPSLCKILQDEKTMYAYEGAFNDRETQEWLDRQISRYHKWGFGLWAVILKETDIMIGQCGLTMQRIPVSNAIGAWICPTAVISLSASLRQNNKNHRNQRHGTGKALCSSDMAVVCPKCRQAGTVRFDKARGLALFQCSSCYLKKEMAPGGPPAFDVTAQCTSTGK